jgi:class 3 adenylate cyclase
MTTKLATHVRRTIQFDEKASQPRRGVVMMYDLEGFSRFFNQPDVQDYVPVFINHVSMAVGACIYGGDHYWRSDGGAKLPQLPILPVHEKFLGDGAMYVWLHSDVDALTTDFTRHLCNRLWTLKRNFKSVVAAASDLLPVLDVPARLRFGVAAGTIYELVRRLSGDGEYIGFCINLASRLQKYCPELGFIASARIGLPQAILDEHNYIKVVAKSLKGFPREVVIVDKGEWEALGPTVREALFETL